jgi:hypothetical protein
VIPIFHAKFHHRSFPIFKLFEYFDHSGRQVVQKTFNEKQPRTNSGGSPGENS